MKICSTPLRSADVTLDTVCSAAADDHYKKKIKYSFKNSLVSVDRIKKSSSPYIVMSQKIVKVQICQGKDYNPHNIKYPLADDTI